ncbi:MAG: type II secretion system protein [Acidobacteriota bacterium]
MTQKMRSKKGFTLIEMMIVIAVIAILAAVLIPRAGLVQQSAKETGVEGNARTVFGVTSAMVPKYTSGADLLAAVGPKIATANLLNPITNGTTVEQTASATTAVVYANSTATFNGGANYAGAVALYVPATLSVGCLVYAYDKDGAIISGYPQKVY